MLMFVRADVCVFNIYLYAQLHNTSFGNKDAPTLLFNYMLTSKWPSKYIIQNSLGQCRHAYVCARICLCMQHMLKLTASQYKLWQ